MHVNIFQIKIRVWLLFSKFCSINKMQKSCFDPRVKKSLVRHSEQKLRPPLKAKAVHDSEIRRTNSEPESSLLSSQKENELGQPTTCSSEVFANYLNDVKKCLPPLIAAEVLLNEDKNKINANLTKKLNFQFTDSIYKNLVELNASFEDLRAKKERRPAGRAVVKKDLEPNIEDFFEDEPEVDCPPEIPVIRPKFKPLKKVENGQLHKLVASFENF